METRTTNGAAAVSEVGARKRTMYARWLSMLFLLGICGLVVYEYQGSIWSLNYDFAHHYALVARIEEFGRLPTAPDPSLEEMNVYPRFAHIWAAVLGWLSDSPLAGMQFAAFLSLAALWAAVALMFSSLPRGALLMVSAGAVALWAVNRLYLHLELFGDELIGNYFFAQLVAQAAAMIVLALVLFMERAGRSPLAGYVVLGSAVPLIVKIHALPAMEILTVLAFLVLLDLVVGGVGNRRPAFVFGVIIALASFLVTVLNPEFAAMARLSANEGVLVLNYTSSAVGLAIESAAVILLSFFLLWQWSRLVGTEARKGGLVLKYWGLFGVAVAGACLLQLALLHFGLGSLYASKKYAFGLNTALFLDLPLLTVRPKALAQTGGHRSADWAATVFRRAFPGLFVLLACFAVLPPPSSRVIAVADVQAAERFAFKYADPHPGSASGNYDYAIGLFGGMHGLDYMITIGVLRARRDRNTDDIAMGYALQKPGEVGRIFTREGSTPWDVPECRILVTKDGFAILNGACVLAKVRQSK